MGILQIVESKAFQVRPDSPSLRATIPLAVVQTLKINPSDTLLWELRAEDGELYAIVKKKQAHPSQNSGEVKK